MQGERDNFRLRIRLLLFEKGQRTVGRRTAASAFAGEKLDQNELPGGQRRRLGRLISRAFLTFNRIDRAGGGSKNQKKKKHCRSHKHDYTRTRRFCSKLGTFRFGLFNFGPPFYFAFDLVKSNFAQTTEFFIYASSKVKRRSNRSSRRAGS
jgi:hypothetical protein